MRSLPSLPRFVTSERGWLVYSIGGHNSVELLRSTTIKLLRLDNDCASPTTFSIGHRGSYQISLFADLSSCLVRVSRTPLVVHQSSPEVVIEIFRDGENVGSITLSIRATISTDDLSLEKELGEKLFKVYPSYGDVSHSPLFKEPLRTLADNLLKT